MKMLLNLIGSVIRKVSIYDAEMRVLTTDQT